MMNNEKDKTEKTQKSSDDVVLTEIKPKKNESPDVITKDVVGAEKGADNKQNNGQNGDGDAAKDKKDGEDGEKDGDKKDEDEDRNCCMKCLCACYNHQWCPEESYDYYPPPPVIQTEREKELRKLLPDFTFEAMEIQCPRCEKDITTLTESVAGCLTCLLSCAICMTGIGCIGPCFAPYYINRFLNMNHYCPDCKAYIGSFKRMCEDEEEHC